MSWSSRLPSFGGRWSPFSGSSDSRSTKPSQPIQVQESDYSYINPDDLDSPTATSPTPTSTYPSSSTGKPAQPTPSSLPRPPRETDIVVFRHGKSRHTVHFPSYSLTDGHLTIGDLRAQAARKLDVSADPKRVRMFYKGRNLKDDRELARAEGLTSDAEPEVLCVLGDSGVPAAGASSAATGDALSGDSDSGDDGGADTPDGEDGGGAPKRRRNRNRNKKKGKRGNASSATSTPGAGAAQNSGTSSPVPPSTPLTPMAKLEAIATNFRATLLPQCVAFAAAPPADAAKRAFDHKRLTETILAQILLKLDAVEVEGEEAARLRRRELVREVQGWLGRLDEVIKG